MSLFVSIAFWVLMWFGREELESRSKWLLVLAWVLGLVVLSFVPAGKYVFMTWVAILDIGLVIAIFGGDITIR